jgi:SH3-like domain-containing protein
MLLVVTGVAAQAQTQRKPPYWASIAASEAMMRTGPGKEYPASWEYHRADLPIRVVEIYKNWRKIEDPDGTSGWMQVTLLSDTRTALVTAKQPAPLHEKPDAASKVRYYAEPGVVGRLSKCASGWCHFDVGGRKGFIRTDQFWGLSQGESF